MILGLEPVMKGYVSLCAGALVSSCFAMASAQSVEQGSFGIELGTGKIICTGDADSDLSQLDDSYARSLEWDRRVLGLDNMCDVQELTPIDGGTWGASAPFAGQDSQGLSADFRLYVLSEDYSWVFGSSRSIEESGAPAAMSDVVTTPQFTERFCGAKAAFSVGAASHEGATAINHRLSQNRATAIGAALNGSRADCTGATLPILYTLSLGEHQNREGSAADPNRTTAQRRVIIVAAEDIMLGVNLREALRQGIETQNVFKAVSVDDYDLFEILDF
ncbi:MAG: hypothetical protein AAF216_09735 [Pseudomonadota bacterium]